MSVQGNYLVFENKCYKIYDLSCDGSVQFTPRFQCLEKIFFPRRQFQVREATSSQVVLPVINPVTLTGRLDEESGFVNFVSTSGPLSAESAVTEAGVALNFFSSGFTELDFVLQWSASPAVKCVSFYFWNPAWGQIRLNLDSENNLTQYPGREGRIRLPTPGGYFYVRAAAVDPNFTLSLTVKAVKPKASQPLPENGYICLNGQSVPLYFLETVDGTSQYVPYPQWKYTASLFTRYINEISALDIPVTPFENSLEATPDGRFSVQTERSETMPDTGNSTFETFYTRSNLFYFDGDVNGGPVPIAWQDGGRSIQPVFRDSDANFTATTIKLAKLTINIPKLPDEITRTGATMTVRCYHRQDSFFWSVYFISLEGKPFNTAQQKNIKKDTKTLQFDILVFNAQEINTTLEFDIRIDVPIEYTVKLSYPIL